MMKLSIIIPVSKELMLERTINRIKATCNNLPEIVLVFDGDDPDEYSIDYPPHILKTVIHPDRKGTSRARHAGVIVATNDVVFTIDGHMDWMTNDWAEKIVEVSNKYPNDILCCRMQGLAQDNMKPNPSGDFYSAASLTIKTSSSADSFDILNAKWKTQDVGIIGIVYGACYAFRKSRYIEVMGSPWELNRGWGQDEETISLVNWACGGNSRLMDIPICHYFGMPNKKRSASVEKHSQYLNKLSMLKYLPMSNELREDLELWMHESRPFRDNAEEIRGLLDDELILKLKNKLIGGRTLDEFIRTFDCKDSISDKTRPNQKNKNDELYRPCWWTGGQVTECDRAISIVTLPRSGSNMTVEWASRQMAGKAKYVSAINFLNNRRNNRSVFDTSKRTMKSQDGMASVFINTFEGCDPRTTDNVLWLRAKKSKSILLIRNPYNWMASYIKSGVRVLGSVDLTELWCQYATSFLSGDDRHIPVYYDHFIKDEQYRNTIAEALEVDFRTDESLSSVARTWIGSSFTGYEYDGKAEEMDVCGRWEEYSKEPWMKGLLANNEVSLLLARIEAQFSTHSDT